MASAVDTIIDASLVAKLLPKKDSVVGKVKVKKASTKPKVDNGKYSFASAIRH